MHFCLIISKSIDIKHDAALNTIHDSPFSSNLGHYKLLLKYLAITVLKPSIQLTEMVRYDTHIKLAYVHHVHVPQDAVYSDNLRMAHLHTKTVYYN